MAHTRVGILLIATGNYITFVPPLLKSLQQYFLPGTEKRYYLFTDRPGVVPGVDDIRVPHLGFPGATLYRYHMFCQQRERLLGETDFVFYMDVDFLVVQPVTEQEVLPNVLTAVQHPCFHPERGELGTPELRKESAAYLDPALPRPCYWAGGFNGGVTEAFLDMAAEIEKRIDEDDQRQITAVWHDESHLNRYLAHHLSLVRTVCPSYCFPQGMEESRVGYPPKMLALEKDHDAVRSRPREVTYWLHGSLAEQVAQAILTLGVAKQCKAQAVFPVHVEEPTGTLSRLGPLRALCRRENGKLAAVVRQTAHFRSLPAQPWEGLLMLHGSVTQQDAALFAGELTEDLQLWQAFSTHPTDVLSPYLPATATIG